MFLLFLSMEMSLWSFEVRLCSNVSVDLWYSILWHVNVQAATVSTYPMKTRSQQLWCFYYFIISLLVFYCTSFFIIMIITTDVSSAILNDIELLTSKNSWKDKQKCAWHHKVVASPVTGKHICRMQCHEWFLVRKLLLASQWTSIYNVHIWIITASRYRVVVV